MTEGCKVILTKGLDTDFSLDLVNNGTREDVLYNMTTEANGIRAVEYAKPSRP